MAGEFFTNDSIERVASSELGKFKKELSDIKVITEYFSTPGTEVPLSSFNLIALNLSEAITQAESVLKKLRREGHGADVAEEFIKVARSKIHQALEPILDDTIEGGIKVSGLDLNSFFSQYVDLLQKMLAEIHPRRGVTNTAADLSKLQQDYIKLRAHDAVRVVPVLNQLVKELPKNVPSLATGTSNHENEIELKRPRFHNQALLTPGERTDLVSAVAQFKPEADVTWLTQDASLQAVLELGTNFHADSKQGKPNSLLTEDVAALGEALDEVMKVKGEWQRLKAKADAVARLNPGTPSTFNQAEPYPHLTNARITELKQVVGRISDIEQDEIFQGWKESIEDSVVFATNPLSINYKDFLNDVSRTISSGSKLSKTQEKGLTELRTIFEAAKENARHISYEDDDYDARLLAAKQAFIDQKLAQLQATSTEIAKSKETMRPNNWVKFQESYLSGYGLSDEHMGQDDPESHSEQAKAYLRWVMSLWEKQKNGPNPFVDFNLLDQKLSNIDADLTVLKMVDSLSTDKSTKPNMDVIGITFGLAKMLRSADKMYESQKSPEESFKVYEDYALNHFGYLTNIKESATGNLSASEYLQYGVVYLMLHDIRQRYPEYIKAIEGFFGQSTRNTNGPLKLSGEDHLARFKDGTKVKEPRYDDQTIRDILYVESSASKETYVTLNNYIADFIMAQDAAHGGGKLSADEAKFYADAALNAAELFGIIGTTDTSFTSKRIMARFSWFAQYRQLKIADKEMGSPNTVRFFKVFLQPILKQSISKGVTLEQLWFLTGTTNNQRIKDFYNLPDKVTELNPGDNQVVSHLSLKDFAQALGKSYKRTSGFVEKMYEYITGKQSTGLLEDASKLRGVNNDIVSYYEGDVVKELPVELQKKYRRDYDAKDAKKERTEDEKVFNDPEIVLLRKRYEKNGYVLMKYVNPEKNSETGLYVNKDENLPDTHDEEQAKLVVKYAFTPLYDWFSLIDDEFGLQGVDLISFANENFDNWQKLMSESEDKFGSKNLREVIKLEIVRWLCIDELARKHAEFESKETQEKIKMMDKVYFALSQEVYNTQLTSSPTEYLKVPRFAPFGKFRFEQVTDMFVNADWLLPRGRTVQLVHRTLWAHVKYLGIRVKATKKFNNIKPKI